MDFLYALFSWFLFASWLWMMISLQEANKKLNGILKAFKIAEEWERSLKKEQKEN
jgi:hypothetical protein